MLSVVSCKSVNRAAWSHFVHSHPSGNVFQTPEYFDLGNSIPGYESAGIAIINDNEIKGILSGVIQREHRGGTGVLTARAVVMGGPLVTDNNIGVANLIINEFVACTGRRILFSQFRNLADTKEMAPAFAKMGYRYEDHLDIIIPINRPHEEILSSFHPTRRKQIGRGYRRGLIAECDVQATHTIIDECYTLLSDTYRRTSLPIPPVEWFRNASVILTPGMMKIFTVRAGEKLAGFRIVLCYLDCIYDWYAASDSVYNDKYPNDILPWEVMRWGSLNGYSTFCFGGAGKPDKSYGVRNHKMKFGGTLVNRGRYERIHRPLLYHAIMIPFKIWRSILKR